MTNIVTLLSREQGPAKGVLWQGTSSVNDHVGLEIHPAFLVPLSLLLLEAAFDPALSHSQTSVWQWSSIYVPLWPNHQTTWQEKPQWPRQSHAAKVLCNTQLQSEAIATTEYVNMCFWCFYSLICRFPFLLWLWMLYPCVFEWIWVWVSFWMFFICHVVSTVYSLIMTFLFPSHWNVLDYKRCESESEWLGSGLWLVIDGAPATHTLSAQLFSMHGQTWWLTSPWLFP